MSSYFDDASLVMIPSGYKTSKVYSVKPTDGSGDLTFSRSNDTATRVNSAGLIEKVRTNLVTYSQAFDNAAWSKDEVTISANSSISPDGTVDADSIVENSATGFHFIQQTFTSSAVSTTYSIFAKLGSGTRTLILREGINTGAVAAFNLSTGVVAAQSGGTATITAYANGYYRCTLTFTAAAGTSSMQIALSNSNSFASYTGNGTSSIIIYGAQVELGDIATQYIVTTSAAVSVGPVANIPRLDYLNSSCPRLLLEPQRTNLLTYSEQFNNAAYALNNATITANSVVSPDGYTNADTYTASGSNNYLNAFGSSSGSNTITYSVFVKAGTQSVFRIREAFYFGTTTMFNLSTGTVTSGTGTITSYGNGWYRCTMSQAYGAGQGNLNIIFDTTASSGTFYLYGAQAEVGAYATSYIPTLGAAVTRGADACSKTGISSLIGQTEGTIFAEIYPEEFQNGSYIGISDGSNISNRIIFGFEGGSANSGTLQVYGASGLVGSGTYTRGQQIKIAIAYKSGSSALYVNGSLVDSKTGSFSATFTKFGFDSYAGGQNFIGKCSQVILFPTRLQNSDLAALTA